MTEKWLHGEPRLPQFEPTEVDDEAPRRRLDAEIARLLPGAVDEANTYLLDRWIDSWAARWLDDVDAEYSDYLTRVAHEVAHAKSVEVELTRVRGHDLGELAELAGARDSTYRTLTGRDYPTDEQRAPIVLPPSDRDGMTGGAGVAAGAGADSAAAATAAAGAAAGGAGAAQDGAPSAGSGVAGGGTREQPGPGYTEPGLLAGRPRSAYLHLAALLVAAAADFGAFTQVVQLVLRDQQAFVTYLVVGGLTAAALYLAHTVGTGWRDRVAAVAWTRLGPLTAAAVCWLLLGVAAAAIRLIVVPGGEGPAPPPVPGQAAPPIADGPDLALPNALLFLALYLSTGLVAAVGAYVTHNPARGLYARTKLAHDAAVRRVAASESAVEMARCRREEQVRVRDSALHVRNRERHRRQKLAEDLKEHVRVRLAQHHQDPAFTDALFDPGRPPHRPPPPEQPGPIPA